MFKQQIPEVPDVFAYHYNFGHALALVGNTDQARRQYWFTVDRRPRFTRGVVALRDLIALAEGADRYKDGNRLIDKLLVTGQTELARDTLYLLLDRWGGAKGVEAFLPSWVRYYADARVTPERYREEELQRLTPLRKRPRLAALAAEFDRVFLPDHFKKVAGDRVLLLLRSDQLFKHLPSWRGVLVAAKAPEADYQALGRMLTTAGDSFRAAGLRQNEPPDRAEAFRQAAVRYSGAYAAAPSNASAALNLLSLLFEQAPLLDPKGQLFEQTVRALFDPKGMPVRAADLEGTHALFAMHSLVIDWMNEGRRKDGSVGGPLSLLFHATKAVELEDRIRKNDPQFRAPRRYSSRLPARRSAPGVARRPSTPASVPASAGWRQGTANWPLASCSGRTC